MLALLDRIGGQLTPLKFTLIEQSNQGCCNCRTSRRCLLDRTGACDLVVANPS